MGLRVYLWIVVWSALCVRVAAAEGLAVDDISHRGFFSRLTIGFGGSKLAADPGDATLGGLAATYDFALGYSVVPRLALHFSYFGARAMAPALKLGGEKVPVQDDAESSLNGVGAGLTYYFPSNVYVSPGLGLGIVEGVDVFPARRDVLNPGFAAALTLGYEWRLSAHWGLGAAASCFYFYANDDDGVVDRSWQGFAAGPAFSATYN